jgi:hypothetical protein
MEVCTSPGTTWVEKNPADRARIRPVAAAPARTQTVRDSSLDAVWRPVGLLCDIFLSLPSTWRGLHRKSRCLYTQTRT